jgi:hypothetical protein
VRDSPLRPAMKEKREKIVQAIYALLDGPARKRNSYGDKNGQ